MPDTVPIDNAVIRCSSEAELVSYLRSCLASSSWKSVSDHLIASIVSGAIRPRVISVWLGVSKSADAIVAALSQNDSVFVRLEAIKQFGKWLRTDARFPAMWKAVGEVEGLMKLMASMSVREVNMLCKAINTAASAAGAVKLRQASMSELFNALHGTNGSPANPDTRPLVASYDTIGAACTPEIALRHSDSRSPPRPERTSLQAHREAYEARAIEAMFPASGAGQHMRKYIYIIHNRWPFTLQVLERLAEHDMAPKINADVFVESIAKVLLRRLYHRKAEDRIQEHALNLIMAILRKKKGWADSIVCHGRYKDLIFYAIQAWTRARTPQSKDRLEQSLVDLVSMTPASNLSSINCVISWVESVRVDQRFYLLRLVLLHAQHFQVDITAKAAEHDERLKKLGPWGLKVFMILPEESSLLLFQNLERLKPDGSFVQGDFEEVSTKLYSRAYGIPNDSSPWFTQAKAGIAERKEKAKSGRKWQDRAKWAKAALSLALATGSLETCDDVVLWARRFNRDNFTAKDFHSSSGVGSEETVNILVGIPSGKPKDVSPSMEQVSRSVQTANRVMLHLLDTAAMAIREPSFSRRHWSSVLDLPRRVVRKRMESVQSLQRHTDSSDDDIMNAIGKSTLEFLLGVERFSLKEGHEKLELHSLSGPLGPWDAAPQESPVMCAFFNELAKSRDELWQEYRLREHPSVGTLSSLWPRGLPLHFLCTKLECRGMAYLQTRAEAIVFMESSMALQSPPEDQDVTEAIGPFVDNYDSALGIYLASSNSVGDRDARMRRAWEHATTELTGTRMTPEEASLFWRAHFVGVTKKIGVSFPSKLAQASSSFHMPKLPDNTSENPVEWDPDQESSASLRLDARPLPLTCFDCMLQAPCWSGTPVKTPFKMPEALTTVPCANPPHILLSLGHGHFSQPYPDALVGAVLAYLNTRYGSDTSFLLRPFPSRDDVRFPAFYLDQDFLERANKVNCMWHLVQVSKDAPIPLLTQLARSLLASLGKEGDSTSDIRFATMSIIQWLARSDRPAAACELVEDIVLNHQDESSWHRHLLNAGYLRRLPSANARAFLSSIGLKISSKLAKSSEAKQPVDQAEVNGTRSSPLVKITTVKMLAQMLRGVSYVDQTLACDILVGLLTKAKHIDIRVAVVDGLISMLKTEPKNGPNLNSVIFDVIEKHVVPIASAPNELRPTTEAQWVEAESGGPLPEVHLDPSMPPMLKLLVNAVIQWDQDSSERQEWTTRVLVPVVEQSAANHRRWIAIFTKRNYLTIALDSLPNIPMRPSLLWQSLDREPEFLTRDNLEALKRQSMMDLRRPDDILAANKCVNDPQNPELKKSNAGQHWLSLWPKRNLLTSDGFFLIIKWLKMPLPNQAKDDGISFEELQQFIMDVAKIYILECRTDEFDTLLDQLASAKPQHQDLWLANCLPLLEQFVEGIDDMRSDEWQSDPERKPAILPETFPIKLRILEQTHKLESARAPSDEWIQDFSLDVAMLVHQLIGDNMLYHEKWPDFKKSVMRVFPSKEYVRIALALVASVRVDGLLLTLVDLLRIELADELLRQAVGPQDAVVAERARGLIRDWARSPVERVRLRGSTTLNLLKSAPKSGKKKGWFHEEVLDG